MKVLYISNFSKKFNEGMRNIANHMGDYKNRRYDIKKLTAKQFLKQKKKEKFEIIHIILRANVKGYIVGLVSKIRYRKSRILMSIVQPPSKFFLNVIRVFNPFDKVYVLAKDLEKMLSERGINVSRFNVGVDMNKFTPLNKDIDCKIEEELCLDKNKSTVLHVGHCTKGRNIEVFMEINRNKYNRVFICSDLNFEVKLKEKLIADGVKVIDRYLEKIEEVYRLADVYIMPTESRDFVIDIPLSMLEALACGVPVIVYNNRLNLFDLPLIDKDAVFKHSGDINEEIEKLIGKKSNESFIDKGYSWVAMSKYFSEEYHRLLLEE